ncbi:MAG TPA: ATP-binding protein [Nitrospira sp.]
MTARPISATGSPSSPIDHLDLITSFSKEMGALTDVGALSGHIIRGLCRAGGATRGALYLFDREQDCYRLTGSITSTGATDFPATLLLSHPIPHQLIQGIRPGPGNDHALHLASTDQHRGLEAAMTAMHVARYLTHISRGRLIAFSLLDAGRPHDGHHDSMPSLLHALAQTATNALDTSMLLEDLHRSHLLMKRTDRLRSLETIAGGFAHEIRNPLTSIKTFIQLAPERKDDPDFIGEFSRIVLDDVYRIERLIEEILDYARYMEPKLTEEDINDIVSSCLYFIDVKADSLGIKIEKELASGLPRVMLDRQQIKQVFLNLFLNALDAMGEQGGTLRVKTRTLPRPGGKQWVQIETEDSGHGIQDVNLEQIFDPFFTTKHESGEHEGTGLGLTIVHQIIQEHQGEISVRSTVGTGTTFLVNLPAIPS